MKADIHIHNVSEIARPFIDASGRKSVKVDLNRSADLIKYIAFLYLNNDSANISIDGVDKQTFESIKEVLHSAALAKLNKLKEQNQ